MQLNPSIPAPVLKANQDVASLLRRANQDTVLAKQCVGEASVPSATKRVVAFALAAAEQAAAGVEALGSGNLLDGTFQRYARHSVRHLSKAAEMLARDGELSSDGRKILAQTLFDAEVATRLGAEAGARSLENPSPKALERATQFAGGGGSDSAASGPVWVDGQWLDALGNPVRGGGGGYSGPDGAGYGWDGSPDRGSDGGYVGPDGGYVGPDGGGYTGI